MNKRRFISILRISASIFLIGAFAGEYQTHACTSLIVGKEKSKTGRVIIGHAEDFGSNTAHLMFKAESVSHKPGDLFFSFVGTEIPQPAETYAYIACKAFNRSACPGDLNTGINQKFVAVVQNEAWTRDIPRNADLNTYTQGRLLFDDLTRLVLERANTAREAVLIIGGMSEKYGLVYDPGAIYGVADPTEGWWIEVVPDGHWLATRVPDDSAEMRANCFRCGPVDLNDSENVMHSQGLVDYAIHKGWYDPAADGSFSFSTVFGHPASLQDEENLSRHRMSEQLLGGDDKMSFTDALAFIRSTYEGCENRIVDPVTGSPFRTADRTISSMYTEMGFVADLNNTLPAEIGACGWWALSCPATGIFLPWFLATTEFPDAFLKGTDTYDSRSAYWKFVEIARLTDWKYNLLYPLVSSTRNEFENNVLAEQPAVREKANQLFKNRGALEAASFLTDYSNTTALEALKVADELLVQMKTRGFEEFDIIQE